MAMKTEKQESIELIGLLDSPFVRRVAVTLYEHNVAFQLRPLSVYKPQIEETNILMTAPMLILADGRRLIDSRAICDYLDRQYSHAGQHPIDANMLLEDEQCLALMILACEKVGQLWREVVYRDEQFRVPAIIERMRSQIRRSLVAADAFDFSRRSMRVRLFAAITVEFVSHYDHDALGGCDRLRSVYSELRDRPSIVASRFTEADISGWKSGSATPFE